jgi:signal transduction histidine kinase
MGLSLIGVVIAELSLTRAHFWAVIAFIAPLVFARQMFFRTMALEEASIELKDRERVLRALSNRMAEERQDERLRIAAYLHDDLAQGLFQLTLRLEMAKKRLSQGDLKGVSADLDHITDIKGRTSDMVRTLVKDLHHAPIGRTGLPDALGTLAMDLQQASSVQIGTEVVEVVLPPPIQLLIYQIAREAVLNALKHAEPRNVMITLTETDDGVSLQVNDDGSGFDTELPAPEGHFGTVMMRERALVAGGSFEVRSSPGAGTSITATFPRVWMDEAAEQQDPGGSTPKSTSRLEAPVARPSDPADSARPDRVTTSSPEAPAPAGAPAEPPSRPPAPSHPLTA